MTSGQYYVRATKLSGLREMGQDRGADLALLMRHAGLDPAALTHPEMLLDYRSFCALLRACALEWDIPDLGIRMAKAQAIDFLGPVALVTRMEATLGAALRAIIGNLVLYTNATVLALEEQGDTASFILNRRPNAPDGRENAELVTAQGKLVLDGIAGLPVPLIETSFSHGRGASAGAVAGFFGCPVDYDTPRNAVTFDRAWLGRRIEKSDLAYHALIRRYLSEAHAQLSMSASDAVRDQIARQMQLGPCTVESVALAMRMSPRSLQRQLRHEGTSFRALVDEWRRDRALSMVTNTRLPLSEISHMLGYAEQSVFTQAFRRWYGAPPLKIRAAAPP